MAPVEEEPRFSLHLARKEQAFLVDMVAIARHLAQHRSFLGLMYTSVAISSKISSACRNHKIPLFRLLVLSVFLGVSLANE